MLATVLDMYVLHQVENRQVKKTQQLYVHTHRSKFFSITLVSY